MKVRKTSIIDNNLLRNIFTTKNALIKYFDVGINEEGYWNYNQMALQVEDVVDCLTVKYKHKNVDFLFMMDQSSGHGRMQDGALNGNAMSVRFGGRQLNLRKTIIQDVGTYHRVLNIGDEQCMDFMEGDQGPFYMSPEEQARRKYNTPTGRVKIIQKTKKQLLEELKGKGFLVRRHYGKEEIHELANNHQIELTYSEDEMIDGWMGRLKGMLQVLWERGWINVNKLDKYSADGKMCQKDENGKVKEEYKRYVLRTLISKCLDFAREQSAMEHLLSRLSEKVGCHDF